MKSKKYQLKNGLQVLLLESHKSPVVSVQMWVKTGSADETKGQEGLSHFIEHLVFKGTRKYGVGGIAAVVEGSGGELNAYTSFDQTVFYVTISKQFTDVALDVISEMMGHPEFDKTEVDNEREVVVEEIKRGQDSAGRRSSQLLFSNVFKKSPYGVPVIGYEKIVRGTSVKKIKEYYESRYVPSNMFLVIAGDFESAEMKQKVESLFGDFTPHKLKKVKRTKEPAQDKIRIKVEKTPFKQTSLYLSWRVPSVQHKDVLALEVLSMILGQGDSSRLVTDLRIREPLVNGIGSFAYAMQEDGIFAISLNVEAEKMSQALDKVTENLVRIIQDPPTNQEMQKAVTNFASQEIYAIETVDNIARKAGSNEFYYGDYEYHKKYLKDLYQLTPEAIQNVAKKYFKPGSFSISLMTDQDEKLLQAELRAYSRRLKTALENVKKKKSVIKYKPQKLAALKKQSDIPGPVDKIELKNGACVLLRRQSETPYVAVKAAFRGGLRQEGALPGGSMELLSRTWMCGTQHYTEDQINVAVDEMAAGMGPFAGRNTIGLSMDYLSSFDDRMWEIFKSVLLEPQFGKEFIERERLVLLNQLKRRNDNPAQVCMRNFAQAMFPDHPYGADVMGTEDSLREVDNRTLQELYSRHLKSGNLTLCVVGDIDSDLWKERLNELSSAMPKGARIDDQFPVTSLKENQHIYAHAQKEQSHLMVGYRGLTLKDEERYCLEVISSILSGQGGRLFVELRDKKSLAYSVSPMHMEGIEAGYFAGYIGCSPEKVNIALDMLVAEFEKLAHSKVSEEELLRAQRYLIGRHDIELQRKTAVCNAILFDDIYGLDYRRSLEVAESYFAVTTEQIRDLAQKIFSGPKVLSLVGPQDLKLS